MELWPEWKVNKMIRCGKCADLPQHLLCSPARSAPGPPRRCQVHFVRQARCHVQHISYVLDLGQYLYVPSFRMVCLFRTNFLPIYTDSNSYARVGKQISIVDRRLMRSLVEKKKEIYGIINNKFVIRVSKLSYEPTFDSRRKIGFEESFKQRLRSRTKTWILT